jgi:hypothetical protein
MLGSGSHESWPIKLAAERRDRPSARSLQSGAGCGKHQIKDEQTIPRSPERSETVGGVAKSGTEAARVVADEAGVRQLAAMIATAGGRGFQAAQRQNGERRRPISF